MTRPLRLVPKRDNVVQLHEYRRRHARKVISAMQTTIKDCRITHSSEDAAGVTFTVAGLSDDPRRDAWPYPPCDTEPDPAA